MVLGTVGAVYARAGWVDRAREILSGLESTTSPGSLAAQAMIQAGLGRTDTAFELLDREPKWNTMMLLTLRTSFGWSPLRADLRWRALRRRLGSGSRSPGWRPRC